MVLLQAAKFQIRRHYAQVAAVDCWNGYILGVGIMDMQLNEREASLLDAFRRLPPDTAMELSALAERLAELAPNRRIDWSDSWSDEDLNEFRAASLGRLDAEESEDRD
jgi:hypothetical protein